MRMRAAIPAMVMAVMTAFASAALADKDNDDVKVKSKTETTTTDHEHNWFGNLWHRGDWTRHHEDQSVTVRTYPYREPERRSATVYNYGYREPEYYTYGYREPEVERRVEVRGPQTGMAHRELSGPYRYFFTDAQGKYNYYLDRYGYPYQYGGREMSTPVGVLGFVPPEQIGGGPPLYFREERPLSRSIFDAGPGRIR